MPYTPLTLAEFRGSPGGPGGSQYPSSFQSMFGQSPTDLISFLTQQKQALRGTPTADVTSQLEAQKSMQGTSGQQMIEQMRESARLKEQQDVIAFLRQQGLKSQADWEQRQKQNQMSQEPYYGMSNRQNLVPYGYGGGIWPGPSRR